MIRDHASENCKPDTLFQFEIKCGDGSATGGFFVEDSINYEMYCNDSSTGNGNVVFGCGTKAGKLDAPLIVDGIVGFGQANSSMISQLVAAGKMKKKFSHCLDNKKGGMLAVGELVEPKLNSFPIIQKKVDDSFPKIVMKFDGSLSLTTHPHEYLFEHDGKRCLGWQGSNFPARDGSNVIILGDMLLQNRLVYYDLEEQTIGWTEYDCSCTIKLKDNESGRVLDVCASNISAADSLISTSWRTLLLLFLLALINLFFTLRHYFFFPQKKVQKKNFKGDVVD